MTSTITHAIDLHRRGFAVLPVPHMSKAPTLKGWTDIRLTEADIATHFNGSPMNIGILCGSPSGWIVDIDLDHPEAVALADEHLPPTGAVFGRPGKPRSHRLYRVTVPVKTEKWSSPAGMLLELRSDGCQTIAPGSAHTSGEPVRWDDDGDPATIEPADLIAACDALAEAVRAALPARVAIHAGTTPYARSALEREAGAVCAAPEGTRNDALNRAALSVGTLIGAGELDRGAAESTLLSAALACGLGEAEARSTIRSGLDGGERHPRVRTDTRPRPAEADAVDIDHEPPDFDMNAMFPGGTEYARDYFADLARSTQTPPEMAALLGLAIASSAICSIARVRGHGDHVEPAPIWALVLSEPGTRKSAVVSALTEPITTWESDQARAMRKEIAEAIQRRGVDEKRQKKLSDRAANEDDPSKRSRLLGELARLAEEMDEHPVPTPPVLLTSEPTPEALARMMAANGGRALLASAEADIIDIAQGRYAGARNYGIFLKGHAGDPYRAGRVGREADIIDSPALAVALCVQRAAVEALWADTQAEGRGLLARFAVVAPDDRLGYRDVRPPPINPGRREAWRAAMSHLLMFEMPTEPSIVGLSPEADAIYLDLQHRVERELAPGGDLSDRRGWGGKLCGLVLRVALTLHALGHWAVPGGGVAVGEIDGPTMAAAAAWGEYLQAAHRLATLGIVEDPADRARRGLLAWIKAKGEPVTVRDAVRGHARYRGEGGSEAARVALDALAEAGHLVREGGPGGRRIQYRPPSDSDTSGPGGVKNAGSVTVTGDTGSKSDRDD